MIDDLRLTIGDLRLTIAIARRQHNRESSIVNRQLITPHPTLAGCCTGLATPLNNFNAEFAESTKKYYIKTFSFLCVLRILCVEVVNKFRKSDDAPVLAELGPSHLTAFLAFLFLFTTFSLCAQDSEGQPPEMDNGIVCRVNRCHIRRRRHDVVG